MNSMGGYSGQVQPQEHVPITPYSNPSHQNTNMNMNMSILNSSNGTNSSTDEATAIASATAMNDIYDKHSGSPMSRSGSMSPMYNVHRQSASVGASASMNSKRAEFGAELVRNPDGSFLLDQDNKPIPIAKILATKPLRAELSTRPGPGGKKLTYLSGDSVTRTLNDIFGFDGWCLEVKETRKECCERDDKKRYCVSYTALVRVTHRASGAFKEDCGSGDSTDRSLATAVSHALKASVTDAMKRAARHFGDKLGNSLYESSFSIKKAPVDLKNALTMYEIERAKSKFGFEKDRKKTVNTSNTSSSSSTSNLSPSSMSVNANTSVHSNANNANANAKHVGGMNDEGIGNTSISTSASKHESLNQRIARGSNVATAPASSRANVSTNGVGAGTGVRVAPSATSSSGVGTSGNGNNNNIAYKTPGANRPTAISRVNMNTGNGGNRNNGTTNSHTYGVTSSTNINNRSNAATNANNPSKTNMNQQSKSSAASSTPAGCTMSVTVSTSNSIMNSNATPKPNLKSATMAPTAYKSSHGVASGTGMSSSNSNQLASTATPINRQATNGVSMGMTNSNSNLVTSTNTPINHRAANNSKPTGGLGLARFQATPVQNQQQKTAPRQFISNASATTNPYLSNQHHRQQLQQQQQQRSNPVSSNSSISSAPPPPFANRSRPNNASNNSNALSNISTNLNRATPLSHGSKNLNGKRPYQATNPYISNNKK